MINTIRNIISRINYLAFLVLLAVLPYGIKCINTVWIVWLVSWLLEFRFLKRPVLSRKQLIPFAGLALWFFWNLLSVAWADNKTLAWDSITREMNVLFVLPVAIWGVNGHYNRLTCLRVLLITACCSTFVYLFTHYWLCNSAHAFDKFAPAAWHFDILRTDNLLLQIKHRLHYSNVLCIAILAVVWLYKDHVNRFGKPLTLLFSCLVVMWLITVIYWTGSRVGLILPVIYLCLAGLIRLNGWKRYAAALTMVLVLGGFLFSMKYWHPRLRDLSAEMWLHYNPEAPIPVNEHRIAIWRTVWEHRADYPVYGLGTGNAQPFLSEKYQERGWTEFIQRGFDTHNQFLNTWMELGVVAALLFVALWCFVPFCFKGNARQFALFATATLVCSMLVENLLCGMEGIVFCCVLLFLATLFPQQTGEAA